MLEKITYLLQNMYWVPFGTLDIPTNRSVAEATELLAKHVGKRPMFNPQTFGGGDSTYFRGKLEDGHFKITRIIYRRNSFLPVLVGTIENDGFKAVMKTKVRLDWFVFGFLFFLFLNFLLPFFAYLLSLFGSSFLQNTGIAFTPENASAGVFIIPVFFLFFYLFGMASFTSEVIKAKIFLDEIFS
jgi:hypothetical protein